VERAETTHCFAKPAIKFNKNIPVPNLDRLSPKNKMLSKFNEIWHIELDYAE